MQTVEYKLSKTEIAKEWLIYEVFRRPTSIILFLLTAYVFVNELFLGFIVSSFASLSPFGILMLVNIAVHYINAVLKKNPVLKSEVKLEFDMDLIRFTAASRKYELWCLEEYQWKENEKYLLLYRRDLLSLLYRRLITLFLLGFRHELFFIIPKRALDDDQLYELRTLFEEKFKKKM